MFKAARRFYHTVIKKKKTFGVYERDAALGEEPVRVETCFRHWFRGLGFGVRGLGFRV